MGPLLLTILLLANLSLPLLLISFPRLLTRAGFWTLRLQLLTVETYYWLAGLLSSVTLFYGIVRGIDRENLGASSLLAASLFALLALGFRLLEAILSRSRAKIFYLAWTNASRSAVDKQVAFHLPRAFHKIVGNQSTYRNLTFRRWEDFRFPFTSSGQQVAHDITDSVHGLWQRGIPPGPYDRASMGSHMKEILISEGYDEARVNSLRWGDHCGYARRASRAITAQRWDEDALGRMTSIFGTRDDLARGLTHGILGRNKGVHVNVLLCGLQLEGGKKLEHLSSLAPRPAKTHQGAVRKEMKDRYEGLGDAFIAASTDLCLAFIDCSLSWIKVWLEDGMDQQDAELVWQVEEACPRNNELIRALYVTSYAAMLSSIHLGVQHFKPSFLCADLYLQRQRRLPDLGQVSQQYLHLGSNAWYDFRSHFPSEQKQLEALGILEILVFGASTSESGLTLDDLRLHFHDMNDKWKNIRFPLQNLPTVLHRDQLSAVSLPMVR